MPSNVSFFAVHVDDTDRARRFYTQVFQWRFEPWGPPGFYLIHTGDEKSPGILGAMHQRQIHDSDGWHGLLLQRHRRESRGRDAVRVIA